nr:hypothetical protein CFP56_40399 [Quercus suber]
MVSEPPLMVSAPSSNSSTTFSTASATSFLVNPSLLLLSSMSSMMTVKLNFTNYIIWKHQIGVILEAYAMIGFLNGSCVAPDSFLKDSSGNLTRESNPEYISWRSREQALFTFINSTLSPSVLALIVGQRSAKAVWTVLEKRVGLIRIPLEEEVEMEIRGVVTEDLIILALILGLIMVNPLVSPLPSLDLWISTLLPGSFISPLSAISATLPTVFSPLSESNEGCTVPNVASINVTSPPSDIMPSSGPIESSSSDISTSIMPSTSVVPFASHSLPNSNPMLTKSKHGIFKPKAYVVVRNYVQEEPSTFHIASRFF